MDFSHPQPSFTAPVVAAIHVAAWDVPMRAPYQSARRLTTVAHNVLVTVELADGTVGYGESAPATYVTGETQAGVVQAIAEAAAHLQGQEPVHAAWQLRALPSLGHAPGARGALEMALLDAAARASGVPLMVLLGASEAAPRARATDLSLPLLPAPEAHARAGDAHQDGYRALKIKVGGADRAEDLARVRAVADAAPDALLRLDGNQGFTSEEAVAFFNSLGTLAGRVELFEQPTLAGDDVSLAYVSQHLPCPIFADESVHTAEDARRLIESGVCGGVVLKVAKSGLVETAEIARAAFQADGQCLFGCMMETHIAIGAALHLTLALGEDVVGRLDLDGHLLVRGDELLSGGFTQKADVLTVADEPGLGVRLSS